MNNGVSIANLSDAHDIATLVNRAYRPTSPLKGWTHEANLVNGSRTTDEQLLSLFRPTSRMIILRHEQHLIACVHFENHEGTIQIGMLTTAPEFQGQGLGKLMLHQAETYASEMFWVTSFLVSVLSARLELIAFYQRRGYCLTGENDPYPVDAGVGTPLVDDLRVLRMVKIISKE